MDRYRFTAEQRAMLESLSQPLAIYQFIDKRVVTLVLSDGFCDLFGYASRESAYRDMDDDMYKDVHPDDVARISDAAFRFATEGGMYEVIYRTKKISGTGYHIVHAMGKHVITESGVRLAHVWYTDEGAYMSEGPGQSTELNLAFNAALHEESLLRASYFDFLTGLPSMTHFFELADAGKASIQARGGDPVLLFMDLSGMKFFNNHYGFAKGDDLLRGYAEVLKKTFGSENSCRIDSDHFAAFTEREGLEDVLDKFFADCREINNGNNLPVRVGIYPASFGDAPVSTACDRAKFACDSLRNSYESCYGYFDQSLRDSEERRRYVLSNFDKALEEKWIQVHYLPIVRTMNGRVCEEEALSRWVDPDLGTLTPIDFIPALEDSGLIYKLDLYVLDTILEKMRLLEEVGLSVVPHSINLSRADFTSCNIVEEIVKRVDAAGVGHDKIVIEITESTLGSDFEFMKAQAERFQELGFPVWMDDFGSGYSSIDLLQSMSFDLIKFDMSFMQRLDEGDNGKIILTELMKMAAALGVGTLCEGVETEEQVQFLREVGCAKLQGYYFCKPIPLSEIIARNEKGIQIGFENAAESAYFEAVGGVNLYDLAVLASDNDAAFQNFFNTLPMGIVEITGDKFDFVRSNQSYRDFLDRFFSYDMSEEHPRRNTNAYGEEAPYIKMLRRCCEKGNRAFFDETMPDGSIVHSFMRRIATNPVTGANAVAVAVLSVVEPNEGATYASIARALAADYYNIYYVDLNDERFIEYSSPVGGEELAMERHGENFFESARRDTMTRIYENDRKMFLASFTKENIARELDEQGVFTLTYRLVDSGEPTFMNMKVTRMRLGGSQIIIGISNVDSQMKHKELMDRILRERDVLSQVMALSENYLSLYAIDPATGRYIEYSTASEYETLGLAKEGERFFEDAAKNGLTAIYEDDLPKYLEVFTEENIKRAIEESGSFNLQYRLMINGEPRPVSLRIAKIRESEGEKLVAGIRAWQTRKGAKDDAKHGENGAE